jgi:hypothetical protein
MKLHPGTLSLPKPCLTTSSSLEILFYVRSTSGKVIATEIPLGLQDEHGGGQAAGQGTVRAADPGGAGAVITGRGERRSKPELRQCHRTGSISFQFRHSGWGD